MSFDAEAHRRSSLENWEAAASGWRRRRELIDAFGAPVAHWMIEAVAPQPGERVLELAAGLGETGLLAAELVAPGGEVIVSDQAEAMLEGARERAAELGIENVSFQVLGGEWIDLPLASVDIALCRWGYMLMADPAAALAETRRVLAPGGRLAAAVWDSIERNPWASLPGQELAEHGLAPPPAAAQQPGPFALGDAARFAELLADAGFTEVVVEDLELVRRHAELRGVLGHDARHLATVPRRRDVAPRAGDRVDPRGPAAAPGALHERGRDAADPGPHVGGEGERLSRPLA